MNDKEQNNNKNLSNDTNLEKQQNHEEEGELPTAKNNDFLDNMIREIDEKEKKIQAGEEFRDFDLEQFMKDLKRNTAFTKLYTGKKKSPVLLKQIKKILSKDYYEVKDKRAEEILTSWKAIHEPPVYNSARPKDFKEWLDKHDTTWKSLTDKKGKRSYLVSNKKRFGLNTDAINIIMSLVTIKPQNQSQAKSNSAKQQTSGGKLTSPPLTIEEVLEGEIKNMDEDIANYIVFKVKNKHTERIEDVTVKITVNKYSRKIKSEHLQGVQLDLDTLMTKNCFAEIRSQSKAGGLPLLTVNDLKQAYKDLLEAQSPFLYIKNDIHYKIAVLYAIATYFTDVFYTFGYLDIPAPDIGWGKTQLLKVIVNSSFHGVWDVDITPANIFRRMKHGIIMTMGFDDFDNKYGKDTESGGLTSVVDSGYTRGASVPRYNMAKDITERFPTFGPKLWTRKSWIAPSVLSRSISIPMTKNRGRKELKNRPPVPKDFEELRDRLYLMRWSLMDEVDDVYNDLLHSKVLTERTGEVFLPFLAIAKIIDDDKLYEEIERFATLYEGESNLEMQNPLKIMMIEILCKNIEFRGKVKGTEIVHDYNRRLDKAKYLPLDHDGFGVPLLAQKVYPTLKSLGFKVATGAANAMYVNVDLEILEDLSCGYNMKKLFDESEIFRRDIKKVREKTRKKLQAEGLAEKEILESEVFQAAAKKKLEEYYDWQNA